MIFQKGFDSPQFVCDDEYQRYDDEYQEYQGGDFVQRFDNQVDDEPTSSFNRAEIRNTVKEQDNVYKEALLSDLRKENESSEPIIQKYYTDLKSSIRNNMTPQQRRDLFTKKLLIQDLLGKRCITDSYRKSI